MGHNSLIGPTIKYNLHSLLGIHTIYYVKRKITILLSQFSEYDRRIMLDLNIYKRIIGQGEVYFLQYNPV